MKRPNLKNKYKNHQKLWSEVYQGVKYYVMRIDLGDLRVLDGETDYQRNPRPRKVSKIWSNFHWRAFGVIQVSLDENIEWFNILDGQHRKLSVEELNKSLEENKRKGIKTVLCMVHEGLNRDAEALNFRILNDQSSVSFVDKFKSQLGTPYAKERKIQKVAREMGFEIALTRKKAPNELAPKPLDTIWEKGGRDFLVDVLDVFRSLFCTKQRGIYYIDKDAKSTRLMDGLWRSMNNLNFSQAQIKTALQHFANAFSNDTLAAYVMDGMSTASSTVKEVETRIHDIVRNHFSREQRAKLAKPCSLKHSTAGKRKRKHKRLVAV